MSPETATRLGNDLITVVKLLHSLRQHAPRLHPGADPSAYPILFTLCAGPLRVSALADQVHSDVSTVSRQVSALVDHGLVTRLADPQDRRASVLSLTAEAQDLLERVRHQRGRWFSAVLADWTEDEARACIVSLERLRAGLAASRDHLADLSRPGPPPAGADPRAASVSEPAGRPQTSPRKEPG